MSDQDKADNAVAMAWNTVRAEARALTAQRLAQTGGLSDLLAAVEEYGDRRVAQAALAQQAVPEPVGIVTALNVCGEPMPNSSGVEWLRPVPLGAKLYAAAPQAPQAEQQAHICQYCFGLGLADAPDDEFDALIPCPRCVTQAAQQTEREPLTDEQIEALRQQDDCGEDAPEFARIIRIAERAQGIGKEGA